MVQVIDTITMEVMDISNDVISDDLERRLTQNSTARHYST